MKDDTFWVLLSPRERKICLDAGGSDGEMATAVMSGGENWEPDDYPLMWLKRA